MNAPTRCPQPINLFAKDANYTPTRSAEFIASSKLSERFKELRRRRGGFERLRAAGQLTPLAHTALETLKDMASRRNVILSASNPYDAKYIRRAFGREPLPWTGTAPQLAKVTYSGDRPQLLFCCGNSAYNSAIVWAADTIVNASARAAGVSAAEAATSPLSTALNSTASLQFGWPQTFYHTYKYTDLAAHPLAVLLPYSVHSYGVVQAYAMGVPLLAPSPKLLATWHVAMGFVGHKGPGNVPWRRTSERRRVPNDAYGWLTHDWRGWWSPPPPNRTRGESPDPYGCAFEPNDACFVNASVAWLQFSEPYTWPYVTYFDDTDDLLTKARALVADRARRLEISAGMKRFFREEHARAVRHARLALHRALKAAQRQRDEKRSSAQVAAGSSTSTPPHGGRMGRAASDLSSAPEPMIRLGKDQTGAAATEPVPSSQSAQSGRPWWRVDRVSKKQIEAKGQGSEWQTEQDRKDAVKYKRDRAAWEQKLLDQAMKV